MKKKDEQKLEEMQQEIDEAEAAQEDAAEGSEEEAPEEAAAADAAMQEEIEALKGQVDGIVLTGGVSHDPLFVNYVKDRVSWIAPVYVYAGDFEMEGCASGAIRALEGTEEVMTYTGEPSWKGFTMEGAFADVEG